MKTSCFVICLVILMMQKQVKSDRGEFQEGEAESMELLGNRHRILDKIMDGYDCRLGPPGVIVNLRLELLEFHVTDELNKVDGNFWFRMNWMDWRLRWNPESFGGVTSINVMDTDVTIWRPDISVYNSVNPIPKFDPSNFRIYSNGTVVFIGQNTNICVSCFKPALTLKTNPRAVQNCTMTVASWGFTEDTFRLRCEEPISYTSDDYRDIWDYRIVRTPNPIRTQQSFEDRTYSECLFTIVFRAKPENLGAIDYQG